MMANLFAFFILAIASSFLTTVGAFFILTIVPSTSIIIYYVFKEGASIQEYMFLAVMISLPSLFVFWFIMKKAESGFSFGSAVLCYMSGIIALAFWLPFVAKPEISPVIGFIAYILVAATAGFLIIVLLFKMKKAAQNDKIEVYPGWEDYS